MVTLPMSNVASHHAAETPEPLTFDPLGMPSRSSKLAGSTLSVAPVSTSTFTFSLYFRRRRIRHSYVHVYESHPKLLSSPPGTAA